MTVKQANKDDEQLAFEAWESVGLHPKGEDQSVYNHWVGPEPALTGIACESNDYHTFHLPAVCVEDRTTK